MLVKAKWNVKGLDGWHTAGEVFETDEDYGDAVDVIDGKPKRQPKKAPEKEPEQEPEQAPVTEPEAVQDVQPETEAQPSEEPVAEARPKSGSRRNRNRR